MTDATVAIAETPRKPWFSKIDDKIARPTMAAKPEKKPSEMVDDSYNWLEDIFHAADEGVITSPESSLLHETIGELENEGGGATCALGSKEKRGREEEGGKSAKNKKSRREKLRRVALNDRFMVLSKWLDPNEAGPLKTDKGTIVKEAALVIKRLREELAMVSATLETSQKTNTTTEKEKSDLAEEKAALKQENAKLQDRLYRFMSSMPFAFPSPGVAFSQMPMPLHPMGAAPNGDAVKFAMPFIHSLPPLVVQSTTTAEEDAKLHAPCA